MASLAWCAALMVLAAETLAQTRTSLLYKFTGRDFMANACMNGTTYPSDIDLFWPSTYNPAAQTANSRKVMDTNFCPIGKDIIAGLYSGHPDFEAHSLVYADGSSGDPRALANDATLPNFTLARGGVAPAASHPLTRIVENHLEYYEDGLPKMVYCKETSNFNPVDPTDQRCGWDTSSPKKPTTTGKFSFDLWYRDNAKYSKRVGFQLTLLPTTPGGSVFEFNANAGPGTDPRFYPMDQFPDCHAVGGHLDCSGGGKLWPRQMLDSDLDYSPPGSPYNESSGKRFAYTTELHSFFQFQGNETFTFAGDDDVYVFINEQLALDVGGLHPLLTSTVNFSNPSVQTGLNISAGGFYALDVYHAERHSTGSNFRITTSLAPGCNILDAGKPAYTWNVSSLAQDWKIIGGPTWGLPISNGIKLTDVSQKNTVAYSFLRNQVNVGAGFDIQFTFNASPGGEGFAFVIQRDTITNLGGGSGGNLGFRNILNSIAIPFDFCTDRNNANVFCNSRELRMHYSNTTGTPNGPFNSTKVLRATLIHPNLLNDGLNHTVEIRYFAKTPPWLEVFVDDDLFLQRRNIDIVSIIGGTNAFVGFTASTGPFSASVSNIVINNFAVSTLAIEDTNSQTVGLPPPAPIVALANGRQAVSFIITTFDFCRNRIQFGGSANRAKGLLTRIDDDSQAGRRLDMVNGSSNSSTIDANVIDLGTGAYSLNFTTTNVGNYSLQLWFGQGCFANASNLPTTQTPTCFYQAYSDVATFTPVPAPTSAPDQPATGLPQAVLTGVGVAAGVIGFCGLVLVAIGVRVRNQWRRDKEFVEQGKLAAAERGVQYTGDSDLDATQNRLQQTLHEIQKERARGRTDEDKQQAIDELLRQKGELQEMVRRMKIMKSGGDPELPEPPISTRIGTRVRKSFAASRVSRGFSMRSDNSDHRVRDSVGNDPQVFVATNPLWNRLSISLPGRRTIPPPPPAPPLAVVADVPVAAVAETRKTLVLPDI